MAYEAVFSEIRNSSVFLNPPPASSLSCLGAAGSLGGSIIMTTVGGMFFLGFSALMAFESKNEFFLGMLVLALLANLGLWVANGLMIYRFSRSSIQAIPVIVISKNHEHYESTEGGGSDEYWLMLVSEDGTQSEHSVSPDVFREIVPICAGVAYIHSYEDSLVRYDPVFENLDFPSS